jgi:uncharacterized Zn-finger protein
MADMVQCPICGMWMDADMVEGDFAICPYCERETEVCSDG